MGSNVSAQLLTEDGLSQGCSRASGGCSFTVGEKAQNLCFFVSGGMVFIGFQMLCMFAKVNHLMIKWNYEKN